MPPPPMMPVAAGAGAPTAFDKFKMGAVTGGVVGIAMGFILGGVTVLSGGAGPKGPANTLVKYMTSSAATFGFFMSIGSVIRNDSPYPSSTPIQMLQDARLARASPLEEREEGEEWLKLWKVQAERRS